MYRKQNLIFLVIITMVIFCFSSIVGEVQAESDYDTVVVATGDDSANCERPDLPGVFVTQDVCNVQAAVNANPRGKILLKGTFYFAEYGEDGNVLPGTDGTVFVTNDIEIFGVRNGDSYETKIVGGYASLSIGYEPTIWYYDILFDVILANPNQAIPVQAVIQNVEFENSYLASIVVWSTTGVTIKGNKIIGGRSLSLEHIYGPGYRASGFNIVVAPPGVFLQDNPNLISGNVQLVGNYIDGQYRRSDPEDPWAVPSYGVLTRGVAQHNIYLTEYTADATIIDNAVMNIGRVGILIGGTGGTTIIKGNGVTIGASDPSIRPFSSGIASWSNNFFDGSDIAHIVVKDNTVEVGANETAWGIDLEFSSNDPIIMGNFVSLGSGTAIGIGITNISNGQILRNQIVGGGFLGIELTFCNLCPGKSEHNNIKFNDLAGFTEIYADYYLGDGVQFNKLFLNEQDTILDESGNNTNIYIIKSN